MKQLIEKIKNISLQEILELEKQDKQYKALQELFQNLENKNVFYPLVLTNATIGYMLSGTGEAYWEEFCVYFSKHQVDSNVQISQRVLEFMHQSKYNKRLHKHKTERIKKISSFIQAFDIHVHILESTLELFHKNLSIHMKQIGHAKTITFSMKMLVYAIRIKTNKKVIAPMSIEIPIDSRLTKIFIKYNNQKNKNIRTFFNELATTLDIPPLHLDGLLWTNHKDLIFDK